MQRVIDQGDLRPMSNHREAMSDLKRILAERELLYAKADAQVDTAGRSVEESLKRLTMVLRESPVRESRGPAIVSK